MWAAPAPPATLPLPLPPKSPPSLIRRELSYWSRDELERFHGALGRHGARWPWAIARAVRTKNAVEVERLVLALQRGGQQLDEAEAGDTGLPRKRRRPAEASEVPAKWPWVANEARLFPTEATEPETPISAEAARAASHLLPRTSLAAHLTGYGVPARLWDVAQRL